jgi:hypothetical protein
MNSPLLPWSYSRLSKYERCPAQAKYSYTIKRPYVQSLAAERGSDAHKTIENFLESKSDHLHEAIDPYMHVLTELKAHEPHVELQIAVNQNWEPADWRHCWGRGGLDAVYTDGPDVSIYEWKTGKMYADHDDQRRLYFLLAAAKWPHVMDFKIQSYYFDLGDKKTLEMTREELGPVREDFNARIHIMTSDDIMAPRPGYYCRWCDYAKSKGGPCRFG